MNLLNCSCSDVVALLTFLVSGATLLINYKLYNVTNVRIAKKVEDISLQRRLDSCLEYAKERVIY